MPNSPNSPYSFLFSSVLFDIPHLPYSVFTYLLILCPTIQYNIGITNRSARDIMGCKGPTKQPV